MGIRPEGLVAEGDGLAWSLLDAAPDATLIVAASGEIVYVSDHAAGVFDCEMDDLLGVTVEDLLPDDLHRIHRAHRTRYQAEPTVRSMGQGLELQARRPDGTIFPVEISLSPIKIDDSWLTVASIRDISKRVQAEEHLHRVLQTLDASPDGMFVFDADTLRYSFVNEGAVRLVGYSRDELLSMTPLHLNLHRSKEDYQRLVADLQEQPDRAVVARTTLTCKDGSDVPVEKTYQSARTGSDQRRWVIALARDITSRLEVEAELQVRAEALHAAEQNAAIVTDRERIARDLHDTVIQRLFAEGLHLQAVAARSDPDISKRLQSTIDGLDETIRQLRSSIFTLQTAASGPGGLRGELLDVITECGEGLPSEPRLQLDGPIETIDDAVRPHLGPVLREAITNTVRHAQASSVRIAITAADTVTVRVDDDGVGVPDEVLGGHGLKNLASRAEELGGSVSVSARPDGGTTFLWQVPAGGAA